MMGKTKPLESVSVLFMHKEQIFQSSVSRTCLPFPGYHAFPGGKIDNDESSVPFKTRILSDHDPRGMRAIQREVMEELGYDIEKGILRMKYFQSVSLLKQLHRVFCSFRFRTWFYRIDLKKSSL
ncbi:MAG: hypothetical protein Ct9H300mP28_25510 [Pseudomonadota bacterium]|nr:MAG: hypothetical protein Ct9H300mP28_25510 [Pseudomonadota bacterium]